MRMSIRQRALLVAFTVSLATLAWFLVREYQVSSQQRFGIVLFVVLALGLALVVILRPGDSPGASSGLVAKRFVASYAMAFALWLLASVLVLPLAGYGGFNLTERWWFSGFLLALAAAAYPVAKRWLK